MSICYSCFREYSENGTQCPYCSFDNEKGRAKFPLALPYGTVLAGRYLVGRVLGQGGFGITYRVKDLTDGKWCAVKEYFPKEIAIRSKRYSQVMPIYDEYADGYQYGMSRFLKEAEILSLLSSETNIVHVYNYFEENDTAYFSMEYLEGETFKDYIERQGGRIGWKDALDIIEPILNTLEKVHQRGLIHRDISPDNIFLTKEGVVRLIDFGAARVQSSLQTHGMTKILKHGYAPREQYSVKGNQGPWTDIYALSATFYRAITGEIPPNALDRKEKESLLPPSSYGIPIPVHIEKAILVGLTIDVEGRWKNSRELHDALNSYSTSGTPYSSHGNKITSQGKTPSFRSQTTTSQRNSPSQGNTPKWVVPVIVAGVVIIVVLVALLIRSINDNRDADSISVNTSTEEQQAEVEPTVTPNTVNIVHQDEDMSSSFSIGMAAADALEKIMESDGGKTDQRFGFAYIDEDDSPEIFVSEGDYHTAGVSVHYYTNGMYLEIGTLGSWGACNYAPKENVIEGWVSAQGLIEGKLMSIRLKQLVQVDSVYASEDMVMAMEGEDIDFTSEYASIERDTYVAYEDCFPITDSTLSDLRNEEISPYFLDN